MRRGSGTSPRPAGLQSPWHRCRETSVIICVQNHAYMPAAVDLGMMGSSNGVPAVQRLFRVRNWGFSRLSTSHDIDGAIRENDERGMFGIPPGAAQSSQPRRGHSLRGIPVAALLGGLWASLGVLGWTGSLSDTGSDIPIDLIRFRLNSVFVEDSSMLLRGHGSSASPMISKDILWVRWRKQHSAV